MSRVTVHQLCQDAEDLGLHVTSYRPGDGATRYRFHDRIARYDEDSGLYTALGLQAALAWLRGYAAGVCRGYRVGRG